ncbi:unnamed protein product [Rhizophagus irregularis]|nr:unnamed protein product [Rhizophagus irregularis]
MSIKKYTASISRSILLHQIIKRKFKSRSITRSAPLFVKGDTFENAFLVDVEKGQPVVHLKDAIKAKKAPEFDNFPADKLKLWKVEIDYWPTSPPKKHIHVIIKLPLLSLEEVLSCIPPSAYYPSDTCRSLSSTNVGGVWPTKITRWEEFLDNVIHHNFDDKIQRFNRPRFLEKVVETNVYTALEANMFCILNEALPWENIVFRSRRTPTSKMVIFDLQPLYLLDFWTYNYLRRPALPRNDSTIDLFVPDYTLTMRLMGFQSWHSKSRESSFTIFTGFH